MWIFARTPEQSLYQDELAEVVGGDFAGMYLRFRPDSIELYECQYDKRAIVSWVSAGLFVSVFLFFIHFTLMPVGIIIYYVMRNSYYRRNPPKLLTIYDNKFSIAVSKVEEFSFLRSLERKKIDASRKIMNSPWAVGLAAGMSTMSSKNGADLMQNAVTSQLFFRLAEQEAQDRENGETSDCLWIGFIDSNVAVVADYTGMTAKRIMDYTLGLDDEDLIVIDEMFRSPEIVQKELERDISSDNPNEEISISARVMQLRALNASQLKRQKLRDIYTLVMDGVIRRKNLIFEKNSIDVIEFVRAPEKPQLATSGETAPLVNLPESTAPPQLKHGSPVEPPLSQPASSVEPPLSQPASPVEPPLSQPASIANADKPVGSGDSPNSGGMHPITEDSRSDRHVNSPKITHPEKTTEKHVAETDALKGAVTSRPIITISLMVAAILIVIFAINHYEVDTPQAPAVRSTPSHTPTTSQRSDVAEQQRQSSGSDPAGEPSESVCSRALDSQRTGWGSSLYQSSIREAQRRGLSVDDCRQALGLSRVLGQTTPNLAPAVVAQSTSPTESGRDKAPATETPPSTRTSITSQSGAVVSFDSNVLSIDPQSNDVFNPRQSSYNISWKAPSYGNDVVVFVQISPNTRCIGAREYFQTVLQPRRRRVQELTEVADTSRTYVGIAAQGQGTRSGQDPFRNNEFTDLVYVSSGSKSTIVHIGARFPTQAAAAIRREIGQIVSTMTFPPTNLYGGC